MIILDDQNDWLGYLGGHPQAITPNIDRLAAVGIAFTNAFCEVPFCNPSRTAVFTGLSAKKTRFYENHKDWRSLGLPTVFDAAHDAGYAVLRVGKVFHSRFDRPEVWTEHRSALASPRPAETPVLGLVDHPALDAAPMNVPDSDMQDFQFAQRARALIRAYGERDTPFFLTCGFKMPHLPWYLPRRYFNRFPIDEVQLPQTLSGDLDDLPERAQRRARIPWDDPIHDKVRDLDIWKELVRGFLAATNFVDRCAGIVIDAVNALPDDVRDNTVVVLWSDHGQSLGEREHWYKGLLNDDCLRVPLILQAPRIFPEPKTISTPVSLIDLYPTLASLTGIAITREASGFDLSPVISRNAQRPPVISRLAHRAESVRDETWRYVRWPTGKELYDHRVDPHEWHNLAELPQYAPVIAEFNAYLDSVS